MDLRCATGPDPATLTLRSDPPGVTSRNRLDSLGRSGRLRVTRAGPRALATHGISGVPVQRATRPEVRPAVATRHDLLAFQRDHRSAGRDQPGINGRRRSMLIVGARARPIALLLAGAVLAVGGAGCGGLRPRRPRLRHRAGEANAAPASTTPAGGSSRPPPTSSGPPPSAARTWDRSGRRGRFPVGVVDNAPPAYGDDRLLVVRRAAADGEAASTRSSSSSGTGACSQPVSTAADTPSRRASWPGSSLYGPPVESPTHVSGSGGRGGRAGGCARAHDTSGRSQPVDQPWNRGGFANNLVQRVPVTVVS